MQSNDNPDHRQIVDTICEQLKQVVPEVGSLSEETDLTMDVHIDSAATMALVFELEESFDVSVPLNDLSSVRTIGDLAAIITKLKVQAEESSAPSEGS